MPVAKFLNNVNANFAFSALLLCTPAVTFCHSLCSSPIISSTAFKLIIYVLRSFPHRDIDLLSGLNFFQSIMEGDPEELQVSDIHMNLHIFQPK